MIIIIKTCVMVAQACCIIPHHYSYRNPASPPRVFVLMSFALRFLGRLGETVDKCRARITATSMFLLNRDVELPQDTAASHKVNKLGY